MTIKKAGLYGEKKYVFNDPSEWPQKHAPIAQCAFCGDDATRKALDNTPLCENCAPMYKPSRG